ncbi:MAG TPA: hypothetical protein VGC57_07760, partial [Cellulomonas sp.]
MTATVLVAVPSALRAELFTADDVDRLGAAARLLDGTGGAAPAVRPGPGPVPGPASGIDGTAAVASRDALRWVEGGAA